MEGASIEKKAIPGFWSGLPGPLALAVWPVCSLFAHNFDELGWDPTALRWGGLIVVGALTLYLVSWLVARRGDVAALLTATSVAFFYGFPWLAKALPQSVGPLRTEILLFGAWAFALVLVWKRLRKAASLRGALRVLELMAAAAIVLALVPLVTAEGPTRGEGPEPSAGSAAPATRVEDRTPLPDVYYIVLDAYARDDVLLHHFGFDNREFLAELGRRGFFVASEGTSNYSQTRLSIPSTLNMDYLTALEPRLSAKRQERRRRRLPRGLLNRLIQQASIFERFRSLGYRFHLVTSAFKGTSSSPWADAVYDCGGISQFGVLVIQQSVLSLLQGELLLTSQRGQLLCQYETVASLAAAEGPKFVFTHIVSPHSPWLFNADGSRVETPQDFAQGAQGEAKASAVRHYLEQLRFNNAKLLALVDAILDRGEGDPIIVLQSDHGSQYALETSDYERLQDRVREAEDAEVLELMRPGTPFATVVHHRMAILSAYRFPGAGSEGLYPSISPVNSFRVLFDAYFGTSLGLLEDRNYYSPYGQRYRLFDVTDVARGRLKAHGSGSTAPGGESDAPPG